MQSVCRENRVEHALAITKNAAEASDTAWDGGPHALVLGTLRRSCVFPACGTRFSEQMLCIDKCTFMNNPV
jgi:hypothetical protein